MNLIEIIIISATNALFLLLGVAITTRKQIKSPAKILQEHKGNKAQMKENKALQTMMENIESYDGTTRGQKKIGDI